MSTQHRMRWKCFATNHEPLAYITPQEFEDHMRNNHAGHFQEDELAFIVEISAHPITPTLEHCPFCSYTDGNFEEHVGQHLREFALRSLPWPDHEEKGSQHSSQCDSDSTSSAKSRETLNDTGEWLPLPIFDDVGDNDNDDAMEIEKESGNRLKLYGQFPKIAAQHEPLILESLNDETIEAFACNKYKVGNVKSLIRVLSGKTSKFERIRESNSWIDISKEPASLLKYLESRSELFSERIIRIMSLLIGYDVLHQNGISWFQRGLNSANVYFFQTADRKTPLRPFIQVNLPEPSEAISLRVDNENNYDADVDGFDGGHPCPALIDLAVVLIEIYFAKPFTKLAQIIGIPLKSSGRQIRLVDVDQVFNGCPENKADEWRLQIPEDSAFLKAIDNCLSPTMWMDEEGDPLDNTTLQVWIYEHVVQFLEIYLTAGFGNISLANIESYAKSLDLGQLGQIIDSYEP
ncbi:uncharacterized protein Triagg1_6323 [Trichoderma aggressivum f. europaeum]|uniref:DUF7580 domain-containing protein n=1 Tax=Trichoderma aggressivum f. europaeum TaxID=173218 RepID=A0AAE1J7H2_9HYPO|nr:hypothetical protein Triagg1_6323 [Trichoderma aggressivum f. europaeum]